MADITSLTEEVMPKKEPNLPKHLQGKTPEEIAWELEEINECPPRALPKRGLLLPYLEYFGVRVGVRQEDGVTPERVYFPYGDSYKVRLLDPKRMWHVGKLPPDLHGSLDLTFQSLRFGIEVAPDQPRFIRIIDHIGADAYPVIYRFPSRIPAFG